MPDEEHASLSQLPLEQLCIQINALRERRKETAIRMQGLKNVIQSLDSSIEEFLSILKAKKNAAAALNKSPAESSNVQTTAGPQPTIYVAPTPPSTADSSTSIVGPNSKSGHGIPEIPKSSSSEDMNVPSSASVPCTSSGTVNNISLQGSKNVEASEEPMALHCTTVTQQECKDPENNSDAESTSKYSSVPDEALVAAEKATLEAAANKTATSAATGSDTAISEETPCQSASVVADPRNPKPFKLTNWLHKPKPVAPEAVVPVAVKNTVMQQPKTTPSSTPITVKKGGRPRKSTLSPKPGTVEMKQRGRPAKKPRLG